MSFLIPPSIRKVVDAVLKGKGSTSAHLRTAIKNRAAMSPSPDDAVIPRDLLPYLDKVTSSATTITDQDLDALQEAGYSYDDLFEITICAAVGAGLVRFEKGLEALEKTSCACH